MISANDIIIANPHAGTFRAFQTIGAVEISLCGNEKMGFTVWKTIGKLSWKMNHKKNGIPVSYTKDHAIEAANYYLSKLSK